ncbi:MAG: FAD-dependent oxidoreductase, partial [Myxococcales bacterium]|nr:FAD-dependent oxidoreductase [Myxococcales bacterium]
MEVTRSKSMSINALLSMLLIGACTLNKPLPTTYESQVDLIIVGAGIAGLTAAKQMQEAKKSFLVLEAQDRIGGRTIVNKDFLIPIDLGAAWFHGVEDNPLVQIADKMG